MNCRKTSTKTQKEITQEIQAVVRQITASVTFLPLLNEPCYFDLLVYADQNATVPISWEDSDPCYIVCAEDVRLRSFDTKVCYFSLLFFFWLIDWCDFCVDSSCRCNGFLSCRRGHLINFNQQQLAAKRKQSPHNSKLIITSLFSNFLFISFFARIKSNQQQNKAKHQQNQRKKNSV